MKRSTGESVKRSRSRPGITLDGTGGAARAAEMLAAAMLNTEMLNTMREPAIACGIALMVATSVVVVQIATGVDRHKKR